MDDGCTGTNFRRPGFQKLLEDIEMGYVSTIIVKDMSRLGRDYLQVGYYTDTYFPEHNIRFIAISDCVDSKDGENKKKWVIEPDAAAVVRRIFRMALEWKGNETILKDLAISASRASTMTYSLDDTASPSTLRRRLDELAEIGYIEKKKSKHYTVHISPLHRLTDDDLTALYRYVKFCGNITYPRIPARYLLRSIEREYLRRGLALTQTSYFRFLNSPNHNVMDEDLAYTLLKLIKDRKKALLTVQRGKSEQTHLVIPVCLRIDRRLGRWYLLTMEGQPTIRRLTRLQDVTPGGKCTSEEWTQAQAAVTAVFARSRFSGYYPEEGPTVLRMELKFENPGMERQFLRELSGGSVQAEGERRIYHDLINDPIELVPLPSMKPTVEMGKSR